MSSEIPDFVPIDWKRPKVVRGIGFIWKEYSDGTISIIEDGKTDIQTGFNDGSVHFEWGIDIDAPEFYTKEEVEH